MTAAAPGEAHRERIVKGMVHAASRYGYAGASVARVIERAGVSRATFYEHFASREDCFLAANRQAVAAIRARLRRAVAASGPPDRLRAVLELVLEAAAANPACARVVLLEALGGPATARTEHERFLRRSEAWIEAQSRREGAPALHLPPIALTGALTGIVSSRLLTGQAASLPCLLDPFLAWIDAYALADPGSPPWPSSTWEELGRCFPAHPPPRSPEADSVRLPRGSSALPTAPAAAARRERIIAATARLVASGGYATLTVDRIVASARVSRRAFYSCFRGKQDAFLAAQSLGLQSSIAAAAAEFSLAPSWPEGVWLAAEAMLSYMAANPDLAHLGIAEQYAVGEPAVRRAEDSRLAYGLFLERGYIEFPHTAGIRDICTEAIASAVFALIRRQVLRGRTAEMLAVLPQAAHVILAPFIGPGPAMEFVAAKAQAARPAPRTAPGRSHAPAGRG
jgi:AcrR family transcriptional regulator